MTEQPETIEAMKAGIELLRQKYPGNSPVPLEESIVITHEFVLDLLTRFLAIESERRND